MKPPFSKRIPAPNPNRPPLSANIFRMMAHSNCELVPLFPYLHEGAMVPAGSIFRGGEGVDYGHFFHSNSVDEVAVTFGGNTGGPRGAGMIIALSRVHGVVSPLKDDADPDMYSVGTITQRQSVGGEQTEAVLFRCRKCGEELYRHDYDVAPIAEGDLDGTPYPGLGTLAGSLAAAEGYNANEAAHTCRSCGAMNPPFPTEIWGWKRYVDQGWTINQARRNLDAVAAEVMSAPPEEP